MPVPRIYHIFALDLAFSCRWIWRQFLPYSWPLIGGGRVILQIFVSNLITQIMRCRGSCIMINTGAKNSAGNNFKRKAAAPAAALAHTDGPRIEQEKLATSSVSFSVCHGSWRFNFRTPKPTTIMRPPSSHVSGFHNNFLTNLFSWNLVLMSCYKHFIILLN